MYMYLYVAWRRGKYGDVDTDVSARERSRCVENLSLTSVYRVIETSSDHLLGW